MLSNLPASKDKGAKNPTPQFRLYAAHISDVDIEGWPVATDATITDDVLKTGKMWNYLDAKNTSINPTAGPGESPFNGILTLTPVIEGLTKKALQWIYDNAGLDFIVIWERCSDKQKFIAGSPCSQGLRLTYTNIGALEGGIGGIALQFQGQECPEPFYFYDGPLVVAPDL